MCVCVRARARAQLNFGKRRGIRIKLENKHWYDHIQRLAKTSHWGKAIILWNQQVQTDNTIPNNKPDIIIRDNGKRICMLIDAAISRDRNVIWKQAKKILKYKRRRNTARVECKNKSESHQE